MKLIRFFIVMMLAVYADLIGSQQASKQQKALLLKKNAGVSRTMQDVLNELRELGLEITYVSKKHYFLIKRPLVTSKHIKTGKKQQSKVNADDDPDMVLSSRINEAKVELRKLGIDVIDSPQQKYFIVKKGKQEIPMSAAAADATPPSHERVVEILGEPELEIVDFPDLSSSGYKGTPSDQDTLLLDEPVELLDADKVDGIVRRIIATTEPETAELLDREDAEDYNMLLADDTDLMDPIERDYKGAMPKEVEVKEPRSKLSVRATQKKTGRWVNRLHEMYELIKAALNQQFHVMHSKDKDKRPYYRPYSYYDIVS